MYRVNYEHEQTKQLNAAMYIYINIYLKNYKNLYNF